MLSYKLLLISSFLLLCQGYFFLKHLSLFFLTRRQEKLTQGDSKKEQVDLYLASQSDQYSRKATLDFSDTGKVHTSTSWGKNFNYKLTLPTD